MSAEKKPYDIVIIQGKFGESQFSNAGSAHIQKQIEEAKKAGLSCCVIGDGVSHINKWMLRELDGRISPSTSLHIFGHGTALFGNHIIGMYGKNDYTQKLRLFKSLKERLYLNLHLISLRIFQDLQEVNQLIAIYGVAMAGQLQKVWSI